MSVAILSAAAAVVWVAFGWPWEAILTFTAASVLGLVGGLFAMARRLFSRSG